MPEAQEYDSDDAVSLALTQLESQLRAELRGLATVERDEPSGHPRFSVYAENPRAADLEWIDWGDDILLTSAGGHWRLNRTTESIRTLESAVRAVVAGRIREAATYGKWRVEIDGGETPLVFEGATPAELLPRLRLPAWLRRTSIKRYEPYTAQDHQQPLPMEEPTHVDLNKALDRVSDASSLAAFLEQLRKDPIMSEVGSAEMLIERMQAFLTDTATDGGYMQRYANVSGKGWRLAGDLVFSSVVYE